MLRTTLISAILVTVCSVAAAQGPATAPKISAFESDVELTTDCPIDKAVLANLQRLNIRPSRVCSDGVFVHRVYLDIIGTLPSAAAARQFIEDRNPNKRQALIDNLLDREEFADFWAMKWCDLLRVKAEFPINLWPNATQAYHRWIRNSIKANHPFDRFARELLTSSGSNFRDPAVNFYRALQSKDPQGVAQAVALTFMGCRTDKWPKERLDGLAGFFAQVGYKSTAEWKEQIVFFDPNKPVGNAIFPDGTGAKLTGEQDPREVFANWLIDPKNLWFNRNIANRVWAWLQGRGIIYEPDDIRDDNPPCNPELLGVLQQELVVGKYDLKHLFRVILNSKAYQLSSVPCDDNAQAEANLARYPLRRLEAEVLIDAICQITGTTEKYSSPIPEPFTFIPEEHRTITLPDGSIGSPFLELFGRPPRDTGMDSERSGKPSSGQALHLLNSSHILRKIDQGPKIQPLLQPAADPRENINAIYLTILSRFPSEEEMKLVDTYSKLPVVKGREFLIDLTWALINGDEFQYRH